MKNAARYANWKLRPSSNLGVCGFESLPCYCPIAEKPILPSDARWAARLPVKQPPLRAMWVRFPPEALIEERGVRKAERGTKTSRFFTPRSELRVPRSNEARSSNGLGCQGVNLEMRVRLPYEPPVCVALTCCKRPVRLAAQDDRFSTCKRGFDSPTGHWKEG